MTPYQALYGQIPPSIQPYMGYLSEPREVQQWLIERDENICKLYSNLLCAQQSLKQQA